MATVKELRAQAKALFITGYSRMNKAELEHIISDLEATRNAFEEIDPLTHAQPEASAAPETVSSRDILEANCRKVYDCTNPEDMRSLLDTFNAETLAAMCRIVNAPISSSPEKSECIDAFISAAIEHKAIKAQREQQQAAAKQEQQAPVQEVKPERKLPTPKNPRGLVVDFSPCKDPEKLRKMLNSGSIDTIKSIAESFKEFQPRTGGKAMTKKFYVNAIVRLYFPDYQPKAPAPVQENTPQVKCPFIPGKIYLKTDIEGNWKNFELVKVIRRKGDYITVQEVSYPELEPIFKSQRVKVRHNRSLTEEGFLLDSHDITDINHIPQDCVFSTYEYNPENYRPRKPLTINNLYIPESIPAHDMAFDETAYTPERQDNLAVLDDIPEDHEPDIQPAKPDYEPAFTRFEIADCVILCTHIAYLTALGRRFDTCNPQLKCKLQCYWYDLQKEISNLTPAQIEAFRIIEDIEVNCVPERWQSMLKDESTAWMYIRNRVSARMRHEATWGNSASGKIYNVIRNLPFVTAQVNPVPVEPERQQVISKPATRKTRRTQKLDSNRQLLIQFDNVETPAVVQPAKPKHRRVSRHRIKRDYSNQILIDFGEDISDGQTDQRQAA